MLKILYYQSQFNPFIKLLFNYQSKKINYDFLTV